MLRVSFLVVLLAAVATAGCRAPTEIDDIPYDDRFGDTRLDLYLPEDGGARRPAVMMIHGGAWIAGDKRHFDNTARRLARSGYVAASINYRLLPKGAFPRMFQDCGCALAFLQTHADEYGIDPERIAILGYSAGGHLTALLGAAWNEEAFAPDCEAGRPSRPAAAIPGAGMYDARARADVGIVQDLMGGTLDEVPERYDLASPLRQVDGDEPPFLMIVGGADWLADEDQPPRMRMELRAAGVDARVLEIAGGGHLLNPLADPGELTLSTSLDTPEAWIVISDFLAQTIGEP